MYIQYKQSNIINTFNKYNHYSLTDLSKTLNNDENDDIIINDIRKNSISFEYIMYNENHKLHHQQHLKYY